MKITVKHRETEIIIDESDNPDKSDFSSIRYEDQFNKVKEIITLMIKQINELYKNK